MENDPAFLLLLYFIAFVIGFVVYDRIKGEDE